MVPKMQVITIATLSEKFQINGSLARKVMKDLEGKKKIERVATRRCFKLYTKIGGLKKED